MSTDTPRTDALEHEQHETWVGASMRRCSDGGWVESDFARTLERELTAMTAERDALRAALIAMMNRYGDNSEHPFCDASIAARAAIDKARGLS